MTATDEVKETIRPEEAEHIAAKTPRTPKNVKITKQVAMTTDAPTPEASEYDTGQHTPSRNLSRGNNGRRTQAEIFESLHNALQNAQGERLSVTQLAEMSGMSYEGCYWSMKLAEWISRDWPLEVQAYKRKRYYRFRRSTRRTRHTQLGPNAMRMTEQEE